MTEPRGARWQKRAQSLRVSQFQPCVRALRVYFQRFNAPQFPTVIIMVWYYRNNTDYRLSQSYILFKLLLLLYNITKLWEHCDKPILLIERHPVVVPRKNMPRSWLLQCFDFLVKFPQWLLILVFAVTMHELERF